MSKKIKDELRKIIESAIVNVKTMDDNAFITFRTSISNLLPFLSDNEKTIY